MTITIITCPFGVLPPRGVGAVERVWYQIAGVLAKAGHVVRVIAKSDEKDENDGFERDGFFVCPIKGFGRTGLLAKDLLLDLHFSIRALITAEKSDILVLNTFWAPVLAPFFRRRFRKIVYNVQRVPKGQLWMYSGVDSFVTVSESVANHIRSQSTKAWRKTAIIPNPIAFEIFASAEKVSSQDFAATIVYTGRIHPEKGLELLIGAAAKLHRDGISIKVKLIGPSRIELGGGGQKYLDLLHEKAGSLPVTIVDAISNLQHLANEIGTGDIYCYPSIAEKGETFGVAPLEAMAVGIPVALSALDCFKAFAEDGVNAIVFDHRNDGEGNLFRALSLLIRDKELRIKLGNSGQKTSAMFSIESVAGLYLCHFQKILDGCQN